MTLAPPIGRGGRRRARFARNKNGVKPLFWAKVACVLGDLRSSVTIASHARTRQIINRVIMPRTGVPSRCANPPWPASVLFHTIPPCLAGLLPHAFAISPKAAATNGALCSIFIFPRVSLPSRDYRAKMDSGARSSRPPLRARRFFPRPYAKIPRPGHAV